MRKASVPAPGLLFGAYPECTSSPAHPALAAAVLARLGNNRLNTAWQQRRLLQQVARIREFQEKMPAVPGIELRLAINVARAQMARDGLASDAALRCMAGVLSCLRAVSGHILRDNQIMAALIVLRGQLAEVPTGEGKTLATALAAATAALAGVPVHVITANDYLAGRDADQLRPLYRLLGLSVSAIRQDLKRDERIKAYACNLTYCSAKELVFDYLRDRMSPPVRSDNDLGMSAPTRVLRGLCMAIIDEADSVLIDEALTPFVLSESYAEASQVKLCTLSAMQIAEGLEANTHYRPQKTTWN